jgi:hypothetical protein
MNQKINSIEKIFFFYNYFLFIFFFTLTSKNSYHKSYSLNLQSINSNLLILHIHKGNV